MSLAIALGLLLVGSPLRPALAADDFQRYLDASVQLYESLEYERALAQVQRARGVARGVEQDVTLGLHEGILLAELVVGAAVTWFLMPGEASAPASGEVTR